MNEMPAKSIDPKKQLDGFIAKFAPVHQRQIGAVRATLRKQYPTAHELVYDNYNFFVIGYCPTKRPSECIFSVAASTNGVGLCFIQGAKLPDPKKILHGAGKQTRFFHLDSPTDLKRLDLQAIMAAAVARAKPSFPATGRGELIIRSVSAKQRPRRKEA
jgi:hypothetical protein